MCHRQRQYAHVASNTSTRVARQLQSAQRMGPRLGARLGAVRTMADENQHTVLVNGPQLQIRQTQTPRKDCSSFGIDWASL